jgi:ribosomal protein L27
MTRARDVADTQDNLGGAVPPFVAGKNKIINGDFGVWQRGTSFTPMSNSAYGPDRWAFGLSGDVANVSRQTFTPADITSIGYGDAQYFLRMEVVSSNGSARVEQRIEDVRTLANQSVTVSLWAKANTTTSLDLLFLQNFGSGGSSQITLDSQAVTLTTSWQRFSKTFTIPSVSGKTIGTGSYLTLALRENTASTNVTFDFWGVQVEAGSVATPFTTTTGTIQGELAACQRYYYRPTNTVNYSLFGVGFASSTSDLSIQINLPVTMRIKPASLETSAMSTFYYQSSAAGNTPTSVTLSGSSTPFVAIVTVNKSASFTAGYGYGFFNYESTGFLGFSAEL